MPISNFTSSSGKFGETATSSTNNGSTTSGYFPRSRDSAPERGRDRDKEWSSSSSRGREWRRGDRDRSRERDREKERVPRSPSRSSRFTTEFNSAGSNSRDRERRTEKYFSSATVANSSSSATPTTTERATRFGSGGGKYADGRASGYLTESFVSTVPTGLIREKDLLQNPGLTSSILHGNQYGSYHFGSHGHFDISSYNAYEPSPSKTDKDPKDDPKFKAAVDALIMNMKTRGDYDQVRKECFSDIDTKAAFINLHARIKSTVDKYLGQQAFTKDMDKVKLREGMRKKLLDTPYFEKGIESVVNQILTPKISSLIRPKVEEEVFKYLKVDSNGQHENLPREPKPLENHIKHERVETHEIMPDSPIYKDINKPKTLLSKIIGLNEASEDTSPSPLSQEPYRVAPSTKRRTSVSREDSDMSESLSEKSLEIDLDSHSEMMDESSETPRQDESGPMTPPDPETVPLLPDTRLPPPPPPPPPPPITSSITSEVTVAHSCSIPSMALAPPYGAPVAFAGHIAHFGLSVLPPTHTIMDHSLSIGTMPHRASIPPPLPPLPPSGGDLPPPPPSPPRGQVPPPPPPLDDDACSSPPGTSRMLIATEEEEDEPLPPGEEPDSYFLQMRANKVAPPKALEKPEILPQIPEMSPPKPPDVTLSKVEEDKIDMPPPPPPPEPVEVDLASIRLPGEDSEELTDAEESEEVEEDSEEESPMFEKITEVSPPRIVMDSEDEESPMFEKICEVSPPRPVETAIVQELRKELLGEVVVAEVDKNGNSNNEKGESESVSVTANATVPERRSSNSSSNSNSECRYLETIPEIDYKVSFYKRIPDS